MMHTGDFVLLNPFPVLRDEDGTYHCPMPSLNRTWDGDEEWGTTQRALCGEDLRVVWTLDCPVPDPGEDGTISQATCGTWAVFSRWELLCTAGHVLQTSYDDDGRDEAQPFDPRLVFAEAAS